jgi:Family of unknown function (DUF5939)
MSWNVLCPGCWGALESGAALKTLNRNKYFCSLRIENKPCAIRHHPSERRADGVMKSVGFSNA